MTILRLILPGDAHFVTLRTSQRRFRFRPGPKENQALLYCLAYAREVSGIALFAALSMSTHYHLALADPEASLPRFMHSMNLHLAKALNALHGKWENFFAPGSYNAVRLGTSDDILDKIYADPVRVGLVEDVRLLPGACTFDMPIGEPIWIERPDFYFSKKGKMPEKVALILDRVPVFEHLDDNQYRAMLLERFEREQEKARAENTQRATPYLGPERCTQFSVRHQPSTREPRRKLNPHVAAKKDARFLRRPLPRSNVRRVYRINTPIKTLRSAL